MRPRPPPARRPKVRLRAFTADPLSVTRYGALESEDGEQRFEIEAVRPAKDMLVVRLKGISDRDAAEALKNVRLYVAREKLPPPAHDEFYHADLIEIEPAAGGATMLLPFTEATVPEVDIAARKIVVAPPEIISSSRPSDAKRRASRDPSPQNVETKR